MIAQGLCAYQPEKAAIQAGKIMLDQIHSLAGRTFATWLAILKKQGYPVSSNFSLVEKCRINTFKSTNSG